VIDAEPTEELPVTTSSLKATRAIPKVGPIAAANLLEG
jgi:hypothetical protein